MPLDEQTKARLALAFPIVLGAVVIGVGLNLRQEDDSAEVVVDLPTERETAIATPTAGAENATPQPDVTGQTPTSAVPETSPDIEAVTPAISLDADGNQVRLDSIPEPTTAPIAEASRETLHQADQEPEADLMFIQDALSAYRSAFQTNPFGGENEEIVAGLTGRNAKGLVVIPPDHPAINESGQLTDRWGTPYHFHPVSREVMDVTSAGPDRQLFTKDDVQLDLDFE